MTALGIVVSVLGLVMQRWSRAGIESGAHERRSWAGSVGPVVAIVGAIAALAGAVVQ